MDISTRWKSQFDTPKGISGCFDAAKEMVLQATPPGTALIGNSDAGRIEASTGLDASGRIISSKEKADALVRAVDSMLDQGRRALVGVTYRSSDAAEDSIGTRHFIAITGRSYEPVELDKVTGLVGPPRVVYHYFDPGFSNQGRGSEGKLYVDDVTGIMFKSGNPRLGGLPGLDYEVTHVRTYK